MTLTYDLGQVCVPTHLVLRATIEIHGGRKGAAGAHALREVQVSLVKLQPLTIVIATQHQTTPQPTKQ